MKKRTPLLTWSSCCMAWLCVLWGYGYFCCYIWTGTLGGCLNILDPIVRFGSWDPLLGFILAIHCLTKGDMKCQLAVILPLVFHGFYSF